MDIRVEHRIVGTQHVFTSPDLPGLYVAHADKAVAERSVPEAVAMLRAMAARRAEKRQVDKLIALRA
ncbi:hypothetical protein [Bosea sp. (in: a-proteobacteria)]|jgi:hypothetical protein|uniref:hypothetical protein n=1 Tax=Bosea sp. (in: a-proteobacteria) TaxID=1871050 RepID=UPI000BCC74E1|nr:MAG: hypothetical protein B7Z40_05125 [Bosea sp. 12-68-7]OYX06030.1 MAG: hypothetical protein B7Z15_16635 [Rhizobiales bacterium 32-66-8]